MSEKNEVKEKRNLSLNVALTPSERALFKIEAQKRGTTISSLLRQATIRTIQNEKQIFQTN